MDGVNRSREAKTNENSDVDRQYDHRLNSPSSRQVMTSTAGHVLMFHQFLTTKILK